MNVLKTGIYNKYNASVDFKNSIIGLFYSVAPQGTLFPYVVYHLLTGTPNNTYTEKAENVIIEFLICSDKNSSSEIDTIYDYLDALYDDCALTVSGYNSIYVSRESFEGAEFEDGVWNKYVLYRTEIQK